jgi:hypothetical protein
MFALDIGGEVVSACLLHHSDCDSIPAVRSLIATLPRSHVEEHFHSESTKHRKFFPGTLLK